MCQNQVYDYTLSALIICVAMFFITFVYGFTKDYFVCAASIYIILRFFASLHGCYYEACLLVHWCYGCYYKYFIFNKNNYHKQVQLTFTYSVMWREEGRERGGERVREGGRE